MFLRGPATLEAADAILEVVVAVPGFLPAGLLRKNLDRLYMEDLLRSALCSDLIDSAMADAAVRTVRRRSSGSIVSSFSSSVLCSSVG